ncbi:hypothetical protein E5Z02_33575, partial [Streptomyces rhizosphaericola]
MAATTGRAVVAGTAENPSADPVFTSRVRPGSRVRARWTVGTSGAAVLCPGRGRGPMFRMRTGAGGTAGEAVAPGAGALGAVPTPVGVGEGAPPPSAARCTAAGRAGVAGAGAADERTGIEGGLPGVVGALGGVAEVCGGVPLGVAGVPGAAEGP